MGQPPAGGTSKLENTKNNETFKRPQDERDTLQQTTPQQLASNIDEHKPPVDTADGHKPPVDTADGHKPPVDTADGHKPPVDTATTTNTQPYSDAKLLDINIKKNGAASSAVPTEQGLCLTV